MKCIIKINFICYLLLFECVATRKLKITSVAHMIFSLGEPTFLELTWTCTVTQSHMHVYVHAHECNSARTRAHEHMQSQPWASPGPRASYIQALHCSLCAFIGPYLQSGQAGFQLMPRWCRSWSSRRGREATASQPHRENELVPCPDYLSQSCIPRIVRVEH